jgi:plasmid stability protein
MKTTLNIDDKVMADLKREAARQGRTMSELVESALRLLLRSQRKRPKLVALPTFHSGGALVDIADRDALYQAMEGRSDDSQFDMVQALYGGGYLFKEF